MNSLFTDKFANLDEMEQFLERYTLPKFIHSQPILTLARDREMTENLLLSVQRLNTVEGRTQGTCMPREVPSVVLGGSKVGDVIAPPIPSPFPASRTRMYGPVSQMFGGGRAL